MTVVLAAIVAAGIALPHGLGLQRVSPIAASTLWLASLTLRALTALVAVAYLLVVLPGTPAFESLTHWCLHAVLPGLATGVNLEGHSVGDFVIFVPGLVLAISLLVVCCRTTRSAWAARRLVMRHALGHGPQGSLIVGGPEIAFAVAGLLHPRIVVSAGALACLDDAELAAALDHERGHIARCHRFVMLVAAVLSALAWPVPGGRRAASELAFHLERDADRWALRHKNDRVALASVICKAAVGAHEHGPPVIARLGQAGVRERVGQLLEEQPPTPSHPAAAALNALATSMVAVTLLLAALLPAAAVANARGDLHAAHHEHCKH